MKSLIFFFFFSIGAFAQETIIHPGCEGLQESRFVSIREFACCRNPDARAKQILTFGINEVSYFSGDTVRAYDFNCVGPEGEVTLTYETTNADGELIMVQDKLYYNAKNGLILKDGIWYEKLN